MNKIKIILFLISFQAIFSFESYKEVNEVYQANIKKSGILKSGIQTSTSKTILYFHRGKNEKVMNTWFKKHTFRLLKYDFIDHIHFLYPGGVSFMVSNKTLKRKIRKKLIKIEEEIKNNLNLAENKKIKEVFSLWILDRKGRVVKRTKTFDGEVGVIVLDHQKKEFFKIKNLDKEGTKKLFSLLDKVDLEAKGSLQSKLKKQ